MNRLDWSLRGLRRRGFFLLFALAVLGESLAPSGSQAQVDPNRPEPTRSLVIERFEFHGNTRTSSSLALMASGLEVGGVATPHSIHAAAQRLRASHLFREVEVHTRAGSRPGQIQVIFSVKENRPHFRFGVGYEDFTGWYLIPVQLNLDNLTGHGEAVRLSTRFGYRVSGLVFSVQRPLLGSQRTAWELSLRAEGQGRVYFYEGTELRHSVGRGGLELRIDHRVGETFVADLWGGFERVDPDSVATVYRTNESADRTQGDEIPFEDLPLEIQDDLASRKQLRSGLGLTFDARRGAGLRVAGVRGRVEGEGIFGEEGDFGLARVDLRAYLPLTGGLQLALRGRYNGVSPRTPFDERPYLGGLYTVRGFPSHSLSPPHGHLNVAIASVELRSRWVGPSENPRLAGLLFFDYGVGGNQGLDPVEDGAAGIGYGFRWRLPWIGFVGLDVGHPLSVAPVDEQFHLNLSLGWTF